MKVLFIVNSFPNDFKPNWSIFFKELVKSINKETNIEISVIAPSFYSIKEKVPKEYLKFKKYNLEGFDVYEKGSLNFTGRFSIYKNYKIDKVVNCLYDKYYIDHGKPDIIHAHVALWAGKSALSLSNKIDVPYIVTEHSSTIYSNSFNNFQRRKLKSIYSNANKVLAVSLGLAEHISKEFNIQDIEVMPNVVDTESFKYQPKIEGNKEFKIISVGNLKASKRFDLLINAFAEVLKGRKNIKLDIIGEGVEKLNLNNIIQEKQLTNSVKLLGAVPHNELPKHFNSANLFILASDIETFGVVFIEALSSGIPVIGTKCGGPEGIINDKNGVLIEKNDKKALSKAIKFVMDNYNNFNQSEIAIEAKSKYNSTKIAEMHKELYQKTLCD